MIQPKPLWEVMYESFWRCPKENWRLSCAYMIRSVRDWLLPEEPEPSFDADGYEPMRLSEERQRLRALLTAEAERAETGPLPGGEERP